MPRNGTGTFTRIYSWVADAAAAINITASRMDDDTDDIAAALTDSVAADGQTTMSGNLKMGTNRITGLGSGTARTDAPTIAQIQDSSVNYAVTTGSSNAYVFNPAPAITAYAAGQRFLFKANFTNTASSTIAVSGLPAVTMKKYGSVNLAPGDMQTDGLYEIMHDGTNFQLLNPVNDLVFIEVAASNETADLTTGTAKVTFRGPPYSATLVEVRDSLTTASSSGAVTVDINKNGSTILSTKLTIDANEKTSTTAATPAVISDATISSDDEFTIDIDGAGTGAKGLKVMMIWRRA